VLRRLSSCCLRARHAAARRRRVQVRKIRVAKNRDILKVLGRSKQEREPNLQGVYLAFVFHSTGRR
jgi:hypothetical protein